jgi:hypothetical protein
MQQMSSETSRQSRRSVVIGAATIPALALPAVAIAATAEPDLIYAAIETHRKAYEAWIEALKRFGDTEEDPPTARVYLGDREKTTMTWSEEGDTDVGRRHRTGEREAIYAGYEGHIKEFSKSMPDTERDAWIKEKREELRTEQQRLDDEFAKTPAGKLWAIREELADEHHDAEAALFDTTATTVQGLLALLTYIRTDDYLSTTVREEPSLNLAALVDRSLCKIAAMPEPPPWSDDEEVEEAASTTQIATLATVPQQARSEDPIFAAIEDFNKALAVEEELYQAQLDPQRREDLEDLKDQAYDAASDRIEAMHKIFEMRPITLAGMRAKIDFAGSAAHVTETLQQTHVPKRLKDFLETLYACTARIVA